MQSLQGDERPCRRRGCGHHTGWCLEIPLGQPLHIHAAHGPGPQGQNHTGQSVVAVLIRVIHSCPGTTGQVASGRVALASSDILEISHVRLTVVIEESNWQILQVDSPHHHVLSSPPHCCVDMLAISVVINQFDQLAVGYGAVVMGTVHRGGGAAEPRH